MQIHRSFIHNHQKTEAAQMPSSGKQTNIGIAIQGHSAQKFIKTTTPDTCNNTHSSQIYYAEWKK